jgi:uncharacterized protein
MRRRGEIVVLRELWHGRIWKARPWIVVHDARDELALWAPGGNEVRLPPGSGIPRDDWTLEPAVVTTSILRLVRPGSAHAVMVFSEDDGFVGWYVNLERPLERSRVGWDYLDLELDIFVRPDRTWSLLDEDEFEEAQRRGVISREEARAVRAEAGRVIERIERWESPFRDGWEAWRPDPEWRAPLALPPGWDIVVP